MTLPLLHIGFSVASRFLCILAIPLHSTVLYTYAKYKQSVFKAAFYSLAMSLLLNDIFRCAGYVADFSTTPSGHGIVINDSKLEVQSIWRVVVTHGLGAGLTEGNLAAIFIIAINRFLNVFFPLRVTSLWTKHTTVLAISIQWIVVLVMGVVNQEVMQASFDNSSGQWIAVHHPGYLQFRALLFVALHVSASVIMLSLYLAMFVRTVLQKDSMAPLTAGSGPQSNTEVKLVIQGALLSVFILPSALQYAWRALQPPGQRHKIVPGAPPPQPSPVMVLLRHLEIANYYSTFLGRYTYSSTNSPASG